MKTKKVKARYIATPLVILALIVIWFLIPESWISIDGEQPKVTATPEVIEIDENVRFTGEDVAAYRTLPKTLSTADEEQVNALLEKLQKAANREEYPAVLKGLQDAAGEIKSLKREINEINMIIYSHYSTEEAASKMDAEYSMQLLDRIHALSDYDEAQIDNVEAVEKVAKEQIKEKRTSVWVMLIVFAVVVAALWIFLDLRHHRKVRREKEGGI